MTKEMKNIPTIRFKDFENAWEQRKLGEVFKEYSEKNHPELPPLTIIQGEGTIFRDDSDRSLQYDRSCLPNYKMVNKGDFIVHLRSFEGGLEKATTQGIISPAYHTFHGEKIDSRFYYAYFRSEKFINYDLFPYVYGIRDGKSIDIAGMKKILIPFPSQSEQKRIGDFIGSLDLFLTLHQRKFNQLKKLKSYFLQNMFPAKAQKVPQIRFKGFSGDWEQRRFQEITLRCSKTAMSTDKNPAVEYEDVIPEYGLLNKNIKLKNIYKKGIAFDKNKILYGKLRPYLHNWLSPKFKGVAIGDWWVLSPINVDKNFLYRIIQTQKFDEVANQSSGSKMPRADWNLVSNTKFMVPQDITEQKEIGAFFSQLDYLITLYQRQLNQLQSVKKFMLQNMFI